MCGATHRGLGSASKFPGFPSEFSVPVADRSPEGGGGGGTVGLATIFRCVEPESRNEIIGLERSGDGVEGGGDTRLENGLVLNEMLGEDMSLSSGADDDILLEKKSSGPEP